MNDEVRLLVAFALGFSIGFGFLLLLIAVYLVIAPWLRAFLTGAQVSLVQILAMRLRGSPVAMIVNTHLALVHSGLASDLRHVESAYIANRHRIASAADLHRFAEQGLKPAPDASKATGGK